MMHKLRLVLSVFAAVLLWSGIASAQVIGGSATLSATNGSSTRIQLPVSVATYPAVVIWPTSGSTQEVFYALGGSSVAATVPTGSPLVGSPALFPGGICYLSTPNNSYVAAITASSSSTLRISQMTACPPGIGFAGGGGGGGGGGGNVTIVNPVDGSGYVQVNCIVGCNGANASVGLTGGAVPTSATYLGMLVGGNLTGVPGTANGLKVDGSAVTQPVSGTVTANAGTNLNTSTLATSANQTNASQKTQIVDGSGNVIAATTNALNAFVTNTNANGSATSANSAPVVIASDQSALATLSPVNITPHDCSVTLTTGGTAQNAFNAAATIHGFRLQNWDTGHNNEDIWFSTTTTAAATTNGSYRIAASPAANTTVQSSTYITPNGEGINTALSVVAATTGHKISCTYW